MQAANNEKAVLFDKLERLSEEISTNGKELNFKKERNDERFILSTNGFSLDVGWLLHSANTLKDSGLYVSLWKGVVSFSNFRIRIPSITIEPELLKEMKFNFDKNASGELGWRRSNGEKRFFTSDQLAQVCMKILLDQVKKLRLS